MVGDTAILTESEVIEAFCPPTKSITYERHFRITNSCPVVSPKCKIGEESIVTNKPAQPYPKPKITTIIHDDRTCTSSRHRSHGPKSATIDRSHPSNKKKCSQIQFPAPEMKASFRLLTSKMPCNSRRGKPHRSRMGKMVRFSTISHLE